MSVCLYISSSSSCHAARTDFPDPLSRYSSLSSIGSGRSCTDPLVGQHWHAHVKGSIEERHL